MTDEARDVVALLIREHRRLTLLLERLDGEDGPVEMERLVALVVAGLAAHEAAEEGVVFPAFQAAVVSDSRDLLDRLDEHDEINLLLDGMRRLAPGSFGYTKRASALVVQVQEHFAWEEEVLFPLLRAGLELRPASVSA